MGLQWGLMESFLEQATELGNIIAEEAIASVLGKISKSIATTMNLNQNALLKNMLTSLDANDGNKIPTSAFIHTLYERIGMGTELTARANLTTVVEALNSNLTDLIDGDAWVAITYFYYTKKWKTVYIRRNASPTATANVEITQGTLPLGYRPSTAVVKGFRRYEAEWVQRHFIITTDGDIKLNTSKSTSYSSRHICILLFILGIFNQIFL